MPALTKTLTPRSLEESLARGRLAPLYILEGSDRKEGVDPIVLERALEAIRAVALGGPVGDSRRERDDNDWNLTIVSMEKAALADILDAAMTLPLFGGRRLVIVRGVTEILTARDEAGQAEQVAALRRFAQAGEVSGVLVLMLPPLDGRLKVHKAIVECASIVTCAPPAPEEMPGWIASEAASRGIDLAPGAAETLAAIVGSDTLRARNEVEKFSIYASAMARESGSAARDRAGASGEHPSVSCADVAALAAGGAIADAWRMCDAVARLDEPEALRLARELIDAGEEEIALLGALAFRVRQMLQAAEAHKARLPLGAILQQVRAWGETRDAIARNVGRYSASGLLRSLGELYKADRSMKRGCEPDQVLLSTVSGVVRSARADIISRP